MTAFRRFILALLDSGRVILLDKDLTQINYFEEAVLLKAKTFEVELLEDKTLKMAFSIIDELNSANYQIVSYTFNTCALKCSSCFSSSACYGSCQQNYFFLKTSPGSLYGSCLDTSEIPNGYGIDSNGDGILKSCLDPGCADCSDDYTGCLSCKTSDTGGNPIALYFNPDATGIKCLASIPVGFGKDLAASPSLTVKRCAPVPVTAHGMAAACWAAARSGRD